MSKQSLICQILSICGGGHVSPENNTSLYLIILHWIYHVCMKNIFDETGTLTSLYVQEELIGTFSVL